MQKLHHIALFCLIGMSCLGQNPTVQAHILGSDYPVEFVDANLSATNRHLIAADLTTVFSLATSFEELKGQEVESGVFKLANTLMFLSRENDDIFIVAGNNNTSIKLDKSVSDKYLQAFALMKSHSNAVQKANEFVVLLGSANLPKKPMGVLRSLYHVELLPEEENSPSDNEIREFAADLQTYKHPGFSALNFSLKRIPEFGDTEVPEIFLFMIEKNAPSDPSKFNAMPIHFYKGRWGFGKSPW